MKNILRYLLIIMIHAPILAMDSPEQESQETIEQIILQAEPEHFLYLLPPDLRDEVVGYLRQSEREDQEKKDTYIKATYGHIENWLIPHVKVLFHAQSKNIAAVNKVDGNEFQFTFVNGDTLIINQDYVHHLLKNLSGEQWQLLETIYAYYHPGHQEGGFFGGMRSALQKRLTLTNEQAEIFYQLPEEIQQALIFETPIKPPLIIIPKWIKTKYLVKKRFLSKYFAP